MRSFWWNLRIRCRKIKIGTIIILISIQPKGSLLRGGNTLLFCSLSMLLCHKSITSKWFRASDLSCVMPVAYPKESILFQWYWASTVYSFPHSFAHSLKIENFSISYKMWRLQRCQDSLRWKSSQPCPVQSMKQFRLRTSLFLACLRIRVFDTIGEKAYVSNKFGLRRLIIFNSKFI